MTYGEALEVALKKRGMSKADLARAIGKSRSYVSQLTNGKVREPTLSLAFEISDAIGVSMDEFRLLMRLKKSDFE